VLLAADTLSGAVTLFRLWLLSVLLDEHGIAYAVAEGRINRAQVWRETIRSQLERLCRCRVS